jgi:hypothetical protein
MAKTASVACPKCGALNDVVIFEGTFEDNARRAAFSFACRVCGAALPDELPADEASSPVPPEPGDREGSG